MGRSLLSLRLGLRVRIGLWYAFFTLSCLSLFGAFLLLYLSEALEASRGPTLMHRAARVSAFVHYEHTLYPDRPLADLLESFRKASPENDEVVVRSGDGQRLLFAGGGEPALWQEPLCSLPCFREFRYGGHHYRSYAEQATLAGAPVLLMLTGTIDEHYDLLRTVRTSYLLFVPFLLVASLSGGYLLSGRALQPVARITATASRLSISDLQGRVPVPRSDDELRMLAEAWNSMLERLQVSVERTAQFTSDASHDLRTSIAVMLGSAQLALRRPRTPTQYAETLQTLAAECEHTLRLLEDLLGAARSGFEQHALRPEPLDLAPMLRELCRLFSAKAEMKAQRLTLALEPEGWMSGDALLLRRLVSVLLDNAIRYTPRGGAIEVRLHSAPAHLLLQVHDNGPGVAPSDVSRIFGRAIRVQVSENPEPGSGLGLNIARWIAEAHQASLSVQSELGRGSIFQVAFPRIERSI